MRTSSAFTPSLPLPLFPSPPCPTPGRHARSPISPMKRCAKLPPSASTPTNAKTFPPATHGLVLSRKYIEGATRLGRTLRLSRWATLAELDVSGEPNPAAKVHVLAAVQRIRRDFRVSGRVKAPLYRTCDRCTCGFTTHSRGSFEVWLATGESGQLGDMEGLVDDGDLEAIEGFGKEVHEFDLTEHVRDAVYLGVPTKSLCREDCGGVEIGDVKFASVRYAGEKVKGGEKAGNAEEGSLMEEIGGEGLKELREKLERQGL